MQNVNYSTLINKTGLKTDFTNIGSIVNALVPYLFYGAGIALLIYLVLGGFQIMLSKGDPKAVEGGKSKITGAVIGFVIMFVAYWLVIIIGKIFDIKIFETIF